MSTRRFFVLLAVGAVAATTMASANSPIEPSSSLLQPPVAGLHFAAAAKANDPSSRPKPATPPKQNSQTPYCPYGKKADGTCWVRCKYMICF
jgi:hypothetical protein